MPLTTSNILCFDNVKTPSGYLNPTFIKGLKLAFNLDVFVETGTYLGDSANVAAGIFKQVHTIELSANLYKKAVERFKDNTNICCYLGDSAAVMKKLVPVLTGRVLFWLDGHFSGGITSGGENNTPILSELESISLLPCQKSVILIDDLRLFQQPKSGFKAEPSMEGYPTVIALEQAIQKVFPGCQFIVYGDIAIVLTGGLTCRFSPVVKGMTISRLWNDELEPSCELIDAEKEIILSQGAELCAITNLYASTKTGLDYGLAGHYHLWYVLTLIGKMDFLAARDELQKLTESALINTQRLEWYNSLLTSHFEVLNHIDEMVSSDPSAHSFATSKNRLQNNNSNHNNKKAIAGALALPECDDPFETYHYPNYLANCSSSVDDVSKEEFELNRAGATNIQKYYTILDQIVSKRLWSSGRPLRLHLGCGEQYLQGYINIDFPAAEHQIQTKAVADLFSDVTSLLFPSELLDEIRLHHVFEHFSRVTALALLIRWSEWLKPGGKLVIETPDLEGSAKILLSDLPWQVKTATVRHLAGDQADTWAYHVDHWFPERFQRTLSRLGFADIQTTSSNWAHEPYLANVIAVGIKCASLTRSELLSAADFILWESTVSPNEKKMFSVWKKQLRDFLSGEKKPQIRPTLGRGADHSTTCRQTDFNSQSIRAYDKTSSNFERIMRLKQAHLEDIRK